MGTSSRGPKESFKSFQTQRGRQVIKAYSGLKLSNCNHFVSFHKNAKRERGQYPATLTELAYLIKDLGYGIPRPHQPFCFLFTVTENILRKKSFGTRLDFGEMLLREQNGNPEYRSILPAWVANQNTEFAASCPLAELAL